MMLFHQRAGLHLAAFENHVRALLCALHPASLLGAFPSTTSDLICLGGKGEGGREEAGRRDRRATEQQHRVGLWTSAEPSPAATNSRMRFFSKREKSRPDEIRRHQREAAAPHRTAHAGV